VLRLLLLLVVVELVRSRAGRQHGCRPQESRQLLQLLPVRARLALPLPASCPPAAPARPRGPCPARGAGRAVVPTPAAAGTAATRARALRTPSPAARH
jgi:hypothetical protein